MSIFLNIFGHSCVLLFLYILVFCPFKILITDFFFCMIFVYTLDSKFFIFFSFLLQMSSPSFEVNLLFIFPLI